MARATTGYLLPHITVVYVRACKPADLIESSQCLPSLPMLL